MGDSNFIKFLGTAGARFVMAKQLRSSAGTFISMKGQNIMLDPGPGALVRLASSRPGIDVEKLDAIILTHAHIDHSNDANVLIDSMTGGGLNRRGVLFAPRECVHGEDPVILKYLRGFLEDIVILEENKEYRLGSLSFSTSARHLHAVETYGVKFGLDGLTVSFMADTRFFPELLQSYKGTDLLVINVVRHMAHQNPRIMHLAMDDVRTIIAGLKPEKVFLTHFGMTMLKAKPWELARQLTVETGVDVTAASDGLTVHL
ncbi:MBL fold metallo-hydrolase [Pelotomaculum propionicicum]|uniref:Ribonuclease BN n=1 Tax=Pelotomaculum propionicicum TaxID=258475 RepID=A0A4Y7RSG7_9FIRM|nr:MBL fold metallo-hydrolase [Pelotomaculum propionicicum]TEB11974.1 Ribonuclease BN [Pelotomaculum propionicicum]